MHLSQTMFASTMIGQHHTKCLTMLDQTYASTVQTMPSP
jgi:hypothetical protein